MKLIKAERLTSEKFAPFGRMAESYKNKETKSGENWVCYSLVDFVVPQAPMGIGIVYSKELPEKITAMERHVSREEILWAATDDLVMLVDLPVSLGAEAARPNPDTIKAFFIKAGQVSILNRGTWHSPAFAAKGEAKYYFMVEWKKDLIDQEAAPWIPFEGEEEVAVVLEGE